MVAFYHDSKKATTITFFTDFTHFIPIHKKVIKVKIFITI
jgi:hypothetical protein